MDEIRLYDLEQRVKALENTMHSRLWPRIRYEQGKGVSKSEAARMLGVSRSTIYNMAKDGRLKYMPDGGRIDADSVKAYMGRYGIRES